MSKVSACITAVQDGFVLDVDNPDDGVKGKSYTTIANNLNEAAAKLCWAFLGKHYPNAKVVTPRENGAGDTIWIDVVTGTPVTDL